MSKIIDILKEELKAWVLAHGMANGYETTVNGTIRFDTNDTFEVQMPHSDDMTKRQIKDAGKALYDSIRSRINPLLKKQTDWLAEEGGDYEIRVYSEHVEWGCYQIKIEEIIKRGRI